MMNVDPLSVWYRPYRFFLLDCFYLLNSATSPKTLMLGDALWHLNTREVLKALDENRALPTEPLCHAYLQQALQ